MHEVLQGSLAGLLRERQCAVEALAACNSKIGVSLDLLVGLNQRVLLNCESTDQMNSKSRSPRRRRDTLALVCPHSKVHEQVLFFSGFHCRTKERMERCSSVAILGPVRCWLPELVVWQEFKTAGAGIGHRTDVVAHVALICTRVRQPICVINCDSRAIMSGNDYTNIGTWDGIQLEVL